MGMHWEDAEYGLTPREWLDSDPVPLTPDIDFNDPVQRSAWIRANNEENRARWLELKARREGGGRSSDDGEGQGQGQGQGRGEGSPGSSRMSATTVVGVRLLNAEQRALVRAARRHDLSVSDLVRRWVRAGLEHEVDPAGGDDERRQATAAAADAMVERIHDEVRRLREIVASSG